MAKAKIHKINSIFRAGVDHFEDACGYVQRNDLPRFDSTLQKLQDCLTDLGNIARPPGKPSHVNAVCGWCDEEPAEYHSKEGSVEYLCGYCFHYEWFDDQLDLNTFNRI